MPCVCRDSLFFFCFKIFYFLIMHPLIRLYAFQGQRSFLFHLHLTFTWSHSPRLILFSFSWELPFWNFYSKLDPHHLCFLYRKLFFLFIILCFSELLRSSSSTKDLFLQMLLLPKLLLIWPQCFELAYTTVCNYY